MPATSSTVERAAEAPQANLTEKVKLGTFDLNPAVLDRIQGGTQMLAIDQNGYLQGYLGVSLAFQYAKWGMVASWDGSAHRPGIDHEG